MAVERAEAFVFFGPQTVLGAELKPGDRAPDFRLLTNKFETVTLATFAGKPMLISVVPSLDTGVCSRQTVRFNQEAAALADKVVFLAVSADLPWAQTRFCGATDTTVIQTLSDHRDMNFGEAYGTYVVALRIEQRSVFVIDGDGVVRYAEYVPVGGQEPNYDAAMDALRAAIG